MEKWKLENIKKNCSIDHKELDDDEITIVVNALVKKYVKFWKRISKEHLSLLLVEKSIHIKGIDAEDDNFDINQFLIDQDLNIPQTCFLDWNNFKDLDNISYIALTKYFDELWYPASDDLVIYPDTLDWVIFIHHEGDIWLLKSNQ